VEAVVSPHEFVLWPTQPASGNYRRL